MKNPKLFLLVIGGTPKGRNVEQHDVLFTVAETLEKTFDAVKKHWNTKVHIDSYMMVEQVDGYQVKISSGKQKTKSDMKLIFINLGGYKKNDLEEYHKKLVVAAKSIPDARKIVQQDVFFRQCDDLKNAPPHIDDKMELMGFDVDDVLIVDTAIQPEYFIELVKDDAALFANNTAHPGYLPL